MKFVFFYLFLFFIRNYLSIHLERLWLLRHCDKPKDNKNPCCSEIGKERTKYWIHYFLKVFNKEKSIQFYTSNFRSNEESCMNEKMVYQTNDKCQKSQRMFYTTYYIQKEFIKNNFNVNPQININFCIGENSNLLQTILKNADATDSILIWEHDEIIDIIRKFNIQINKWKSKYRHLYDIIFMIDLKSNKLYYECFDYRNYTYYCNNEINHWLSSFQLIEKDYFHQNINSYNLYNLYTNNLLTTNDSFIRNNTIDHPFFIKELSRKTIFYFFIFFVVLNIFLLSMVIYKFMYEFSETYQRRKNYIYIRDLETLHIRDLETKPVHFFI